MKKCLFVMRSVGIGGTATSLLNLLSLYYDQGIEYDVFLFTHDGVLAKELASYSNLLPEDKMLAAISCDKSTLKRRGFGALLRRTCFAVSCRLFGVRKSRARLYSRCASRLSGQYDAVVAYQEDLTTDFVQYVKAPAKVAWCHMDCEHVQKASARSDADVQRLYSSFTHIACVSSVIRNSMIGKVELPNHKISVVYNTIPPKMIRQKAEAESVEIARRSFVFVSMGRFVDRKRFDRAVLAAEALKARGVDFAWYLLGNGPLFEDVKTMVEEKELSDHVILTGPKTNPFVYLKHADCYAMMSENEGQPMVLNEAMTLGIPTLTTDFPSAREVVHHGVNGLVVPNTDEGFVEGALRFVEDDAVRTAIREGVRSFVYDNESILRQISQIIQKKEQI